MSIETDRGIDTHPATDAAISDEQFATMIGRLNRLSLERRADAYLDIDWDSPEMQITSTPERWDIPVLDPLRQTQWYRDLDDETRQRLGLYRLAAAMKVGWHFENLLQHGLLNLAMDAPNGAPEFRYIHHELIEESQHTLMFQEFVNRTGLPVRGMPRTARAVFWAAALVGSRLRPLAFFFGVLAGEEPVDHMQKAALRSGSPLHPLVHRIISIHVMEEARHLSFARQTLTRDVPRLGSFQRTLLALSAPVALGVFSRMMLEVPSDLVRHIGIPREVVRQSRRSAAARQLRIDSLERTRKLCDDLGLRSSRAVRAWWKLWGIA